MTILTDTKLEIIDYGQSYWDKIVNANSTKMEEMFSLFSGVWDGSAKSDGYVVSWNGSSWEIVEPADTPSLELVDASTIETDVQGASVFTVTLEGDDRIFANPTNIQDGKTYCWIISQDGVGNRECTFESDFIFASTPVLSTGANEIDVVTGSVTGSDIHCVLEKDFTFAPLTVYTAKSVILDIASNWPVSFSYWSLRSMDFYKEGTKVDVVIGDVTCYGSEFSGNYVVSNAFVTSLSKIDSYANTEWISGISVAQRIICVFDTPIEFDEIRINNSHDSGTVKGGTKDVVINISTDAITDTTYNAAISNSIEIFDDQFDIHVSENIEDSQILVI